MTVARMTANIRREAKAASISVTFVSGRLGPLPPPIPSSHVVVKPHVVTGEPRAKAIMDGDYRRRDRQQGDKADDGETDDLRNAGEDRHGVQSPEAAATIFRGKTRCLRPIRRQNGRGYRHL